MVPIFFGVTALWAYGMAAGGRERRALIPGPDQRLEAHLYPSLCGSVREAPGAAHAPQLEERVTTERSPLPPACVGCGRPFAEIWQAFRIMRGGSMPPCLDNLYTTVFQHHRVTSICCRMNIMGVTPEAPSEIRRAWMQEQLSCVTSPACAQIGLQ